MMSRAERGDATKPLVTSAARMSAAMRSAMVTMQSATSGQGLDLLGSLVVADTVGLVLAGLVLAGLQ